MWMTTSHWITWNYILKASLTLQLEYHCIYLEFEFRINLGTIIIFIFKEFRECPTMDLSQRSSLSLSTPMFSTVFTLRNVPSSSRRSTEHFWQLVVNGKTLAFISRTFNPGFLDLVGFFLFQAKPYVQESPPGRTILGIFTKVTLLNCLRFSIISLNKNVKKSSKIHKKLTQNEFTAIFWKWCNKVQSAKPELYRSGTSHQTMHFHCPEPRSGTYPGFSPEGIRPETHPDIFPVYSRSLLRAGTAHSPGPGFHVLRDRNHILGFQPEVHYTVFATV